MATGPSIIYRVRVKLARLIAPKGALFIPLCDGSIEIVGRTITDLKTVRNDYGGETMRVFTEQKVSPEPGGGR